MATLMPMMKVNFLMKKMDTEMMKKIAGAMKLEKFASG